MTGYDYKKLFDFELDEKEYDYKKLFDFESKEEFEIVSESESESESETENYFSTENVVLMYSSTMAICLLTIPVIIMYDLMT